MPFRAVVYQDAAIAQKLQSKKIPASRILISHQIPNLITAPRKSNPELSFQSQPQKPH
jgi:hypothetical protein